MSPALRHVLSVEDDPDLRLLLQLALADIGGLELSLCELGEQALPLARAVRPDLILLDVMLPGLDGPATLACLRAAADTAAIPVVFMTAETDPDRRGDLLGLGALAVFAKPFDPLTLAARLQSLWSSRDG